MEYKKLSRDDPEKTKMMAGHVSFTLEQLDKEMEDDNSEVGKKLKSVEKILEEY
jgi:hypothetical protein